jgi:hypothetical protein
MHKNKDYGLFGEALLKLTPSQPDDIDLSCP